jgi:hypothetical protein
MGGIRIKASGLVLVVLALGACGRIGYDEQSLAAQDAGVAGADDAGVAAADDAGCAACSATTYDAVGSGSAQDPYQIANVDQWIDLANSPTGWGASYLVIRDIDFTSIAGDHPQVGTELAPFTGVLDGGGFLVIGYQSATGATFSGLFGHVSGAGAAIRDIALLNPQVAGGETTGALVGLLAEGTVERAATLGPDCHVSSPAYANHKGGLIGTTDPPAIVNDVFSTCRLSGTGIGVAGLVGHHEGTLTNGYYHNSTFPVVATSRVAGLLGWNAGPGSVSNAFTVAAVQGNTSNPDVGLHIGTASGVATNTFYDPFQSVVNLGTGGINSNGTPAKVDTQPEYFFEAVNAPLSSWDFSSVWSTRSGDYPTLTFLVGRNL